MNIDIDFEMTLFPFAVANSIVAIIRVLVGRCSRDGRVNVSGKRSQTVLLAHLKS